MSSNPPVIKYPLDLTGLAAGNKISGEVHDLSSMSQKAFVLNYGPFYTATLVVKNAADGTVLTPKTQYVATQLLIDMTLRTGKDICSVIVITDDTLPADLTVSVDYQLLGGPYSASVDAIQQLIDALNLGNQPILWGGILGTPVLFPPAPHLHDLGDVYGFEYLTAALERVVQAIYVGDSAQLEAIYQYIDHEVDSVKASIQANGQLIAGHLADKSNPHNVTAAQVGLGSVANYTMATTTQAQAGLAANAYMSPLLTSQAITSLIGNAFDAHVADYGNPHQVTKAQVGLGSVGNYALATTTDASAGTSNSLYMTPQTTKAAISAQVLAPLNDHITNTTNPHQVTKAQVGLGSVANYPVATSAQAIAGTSATTYMTPALTAAAITSQAGALLQAHVNNQTNPHDVTKAQVGLGSVENYPVATTTQAQAGSSTTTYMTPALTAAAITTQAGALLQTHISNQSNPHDVTAAQVGAYTKAQSDSNLNAAKTTLQTSINNRTTVATVQSMIDAALSGNGIDVGAGYVHIGDQLLQWGSGAGADGTSYYNFPHSFSAQPVVVATPLGTGTGDPGSYCFDIADIGTGNFSVYTHGFGPSGVQWVALGPTNASAFSTPGSSGSGGGGGGISGGGGCVVVDALMFNGYRADQFDIDRMVLVTDPYADTLRPSFFGGVEYSQTKLMPCVEVVTASGAILKMSEDAEIPTKDTSYLRGKDLLGQHIPIAPEEAFKDIDETPGTHKRPVVQRLWDEVVQVNPLGLQLVQHLTINHHHHCFWASSGGGWYVLHHNLKQQLDATTPIN